jgi:hypothetical protein
VTRTTRSQLTPTEAAWFGASDPLTVVREHVLVMVDDSDAGKPLTRAKAGR